MEYMDWLKTQGITDSNYSTYSPEEVSGLKTSYDNLGGTAGTGTAGTGFNMGSIGAVGSTLNSYAAPLGLAMSAYNTFFGQGKKSFDKNMKIADQTIASNQDKLDRRAALNKAWATTESNKNAGLAASAVV